MNKKTLAILFLLTLFASTNALQFGNETETPLIKEGSFKMMTEPQVDTPMFLQFQLVNEDQNALENYHTELKIYDSRGVKVYPENDYQIAFSDSNGYTNYSIRLQSCNIINNSQGCFQLDENYAVNITGKNISREEFFMPKIKTIQTNWVGDTMRFAAVNMQSILITMVAVIALTVIAVMAFKGLKGK